LVGEILQSLRVFGIQAARKEEPEMRTRYLIAAVVLTLGACGGKLPGGKNVPGSDKVPGGLGGSSGMVDPNTCGNYAAMEAGARLKTFLEAIVDLQKRSEETVAIVRTSCVMMGKELGMGDADFPEGMNANDVCAKVWGAYNDNMKVAVKSKAAFKIVYKPAVCKINVTATAEAAAKCEGKASADVGASCTGTCRGTCEGTCSGAAKAGTGGSGGAGQCNGECKGTCKGECEGHADVKASGQCKAHAQAEASAKMECSEPEFSASLDAKLVVDKSKAEMTLKAMQAGLPKLLSISARIKPLQVAVQSTVAAAAELKDMGPTFVNSFKDQAMCISGQIAAAVNAATKIEANVSVSVEVSASASGSVGG
jgi:modification target Cys-rich repeat protein